LIEKGLSLLQVVLKAGDQFLSAHGGSSELAYNRGAGVVGNLGGFERRGIAWFKSEAIY
jgi:hypothetical protein